ncbi:TPA: hypothetical protein ACVU1I_003680 [Vibrio cholerae]|uniref:hypothetical protein n=1 Tax=Vibrio TaxID=662 RepID=UPI0004D5B3B2|nr:MULTISPECIES: hypothetical protein [Vibrio]EGR0311241.1 hypothetical protein [Vibrio cholerae]EHZ7431679.1 hypothetical protein [Vibrio cholerae]EJL6364791.1 hypothetical protein [Vibrio cholerae]EKB1992574.1 hypothetical protein [Vibrio parahaemolyticus]EME0136060.1 hypothetical protein [Vibrio parahaemolyticus]
MTSTSNSKTDEQLDNNPPSGKFAESKVLFKEEFENLDHTLIKISEEKLRLVLNKYESSVQSHYGWLAPLGIFLTVTTAIITTDFKDALTLSKHTWEAIYYLGAFSSLIYSLVSFVKSRRDSITIDTLVEMIKNKKI